MKTENKDERRLLAVKTKESSCRVHWLAGRRTARKILYREPGRRPKIREQKNLRCKTNFFTEINQDSYNKDHRLASLIGMKICLYQITLNLEMKMTIREVVRRIIPLSYYL
jgi:hypothetical protein